MLYSTENLIKNVFSMNLSFVFYILLHSEKPAYQMWNKKVKIEFFCNRLIWNHGGKNAFKLCCKINWKSQVDDLESQILTYVHVCINSSVITIF